MKKTIITVLLFCLALSANSQTKEESSKLNFDFECVENGKPTGISAFGSSNYKIYLDSVGEGCRNN